MPRLEALALMSELRRARGFFGGALRRPVWSTIAVRAVGAGAVLVVVLAAIVVRAEGDISAWPRPDASALARVLAGGAVSEAELVASRRLQAHAARLADDGSVSLRRERLAGKNAPDTLRAVILLCDFADSLLYGRHGLVPGDFPPPRQSDFYYTAHDSVYFAHLLGDVADYYRAASHGEFALHYDVVGTVANLPGGMADYGNHPLEGERPIALAAEVVAALDPLVDFSRYDTVVLIHAGAGEETDVLGDSPEQIYSTYLSPEDFAQAFADSLLAQPYLLTADVDAYGTPVVIEHVLILPETEFQDPGSGLGGAFGSLGVYCFEVGLRLGMLSLSDFTPAGRPDSQGVGNFDLMGYGLFVGLGYVPSQPSVFNKMLMGWVTPYRVEPSAQERTYSLAPISLGRTGEVAARVEISNQEYWLLEYRLQDPDGNGIFSFKGDLNGDNIPNFLDADSRARGIPTSYFDPATDVRERMIGAEWDFFMSENAGRAPGVKAAGSGLYIWHVDEGVIRDALAAGANLFNADPKRKAVDLEEADGIQDLDSRTPSVFMLGGDGDSFRGEGNAVFGPDTNPSTVSAGGAWTGVVIDEISNVVADSSLAVSSGRRTVIRYVDRLTFRCRRVAPAGGVGPGLPIQRRLDGVDLSGSHLLAVDLDADGTLEIVAGGAEGEVLAFTPDLSDFSGRHGVSATSDPLAVGTAPGGGPARWIGPAAAGDLDGDGQPEIVLTAVDGLYVFRGADGSELADGDGDPTSFGRLAALAGCELPPVLLPTEWPSQYRPAQQVVACVVETAGLPATARLRWFDGSGGDAVAPLSLGAVVVPAVPVVVGDNLAVAVIDTVTETAGLVLVGQWWMGGQGPIEIGRVALALRPGPFPPLPVGGSGAIVIGADGSAETVRWDTAGAVQRRDAWPAGHAVRSPISPRLAAVGDGVFGVRTVAGFHATGWPARPLPAPDLALGKAAPSPLDAQLRTGGVWLFQSRDGRLYLYGERGWLMPGWPVAGPAASAGTPLLLDLEGDGRLALVAVGAFERLIGRDADTGQPQTEPLSALSVWADLGVGELAGGGWPMWQGNPWRSLGAAIEVDPGTGPGGAVLVAGSHICYPNPLRRGPLRVRAEFQASCRARVFIHDLSGEQVASSPVVTPLAGEPWEIGLPLEGIAAGVYLCRLVVEATGRDREVSVVPLAIER